MRSSRCLFVLIVLTASILAPGTHEGQVITGDLIGQVQDETGAVLPGAVVRLESPALIGGPSERVSNEKGQFRFVGLSPGVYALDATMPGFQVRRVEDIRVALGATAELTIVLQLTGVTESVAVSAMALVDTRQDGLSTNYGRELIENVPVRRFSAFDLIKSAPGVSATSQTGGVFTQDVSVLGSGTNENAFLLDGTNFT